MADDIPDFGGTEGIVQDTGSSSSGSYTPTVTDVPDEIAEFILDGIQQMGGMFEVPAFARDAPDFPEDHAEYYGIEGVDTLSVEDLFGLDLEGVDFVGTEPLISSEKLTEDEKSALTEDELLTASGDDKAYVPRPETAETFRDANVADGLTTKLSKGINGHHADDVVDRWSPEHKVSVGKGKDRNHGGDPVESRRHVAFWVTDSDTAQKDRLKAQRDAGELSNEEYQELAADAGYDLSE